MLEFNTQYLEHVVKRILDLVVDIQLNTLFAAETFVEQSVSMTLIYIL